ncbi:hypothetical protein HanXRQr2_Chr06g0277591 [Helianthus annuus]|uniref:Uncharacterized protein n=1 Tax=Helianthus annuus TaxID=4232 RepID=A0A9K3IVI7_HELAN|nr:hypothetical protein HanXRQr2_Chr06g0277591 [Helianthus annuus]KAJ0568661.1 hypothetical protein HanIR_Chr06g0298711 [Helianthus annuus]KAJ0917022.1 hypothetical protein HanPSC8_Chr06g0268551 [Helianthus annuus]
MLGNELKRVGINSGDVGMLKLIKKRNNLLKLSRRATPQGTTIAVACRHHFNINFQHFEPSRHATLKAHTRRATRRGCMTANFRC